MTTPNEVYLAVECDTCGADLAYYSRIHYCDVDRTVSCPDCGPHDHEGHHIGCVCADCSDAELTADND